METTPDRSVEYEDLLELDVNPGDPLLDRPVLVTVAERLPVETRTPASWVASSTLIRPGEPVMIAGDHPARTRWRCTLIDTNNCFVVLSHSSETCTETTGISGSSATWEVTARGAIWARAIGDAEDPDAIARIDAIMEFLDG